MTILINESLNLRCAMHKKVKRSLITQKCTKCTKTIEHPWAQMSKWWITLSTQCPLDKSLSGGKCNWLFYSLCVSAGK